MGVDWAIGALERQSPLNDIAIGAQALHAKVFKAAAGRRVHWSIPPLPPVDPAALALGPDCRTIAPLPCARYIMVWDCVEDRFYHRLDVIVEFGDV